MRQSRIAMPSAKSRKATREIHPTFFHFNGRFSPIHRLGHRFWPPVLLPPRQIPEFCASTLRSFSPRWISRDWQSKLPTSLSGIRSEFQHNSFVCIQRPARQGQAPGRNLRKSQQDDFHSLVPLLNSCFVLHPACLQIHHLEKKPFELPRCWWSCCCLYGCW